MIAEFFNFVQNLDRWVLTTILVLSFSITIAVVPWLVIKIPADYFLEEKRERVGLFTLFPLQLLLVLLKNALGLVIVLLGILMLVLPGQGLLTILIGLLLMNFPGKFRLEKWLVSRGPVLQSVNWLRARYKKPELMIDGDDS